MRERGREGGREGGERGGGERAGMKGVGSWRERSFTEGFS